MPIFGGGIVSALQGLECAVGCGGEKEEAVLAADWPVCTPWGGTKGVRGDLPKSFLTQLLPEVTSITSKTSAGGSRTALA